MPNKILARPRRLRASLLCGLLAIALIAVAGDPGIDSAQANAQESAALQQSGGVTDLNPAGNGAYATTLRYVVHFYPRWFTYAQENHTSTNRLVGPDRMAPIYHDVVAPNDDTLYVSSFIDLTEQPVILTIPATTVTYSLLVLDPYGDILNNGDILPATLGPGVYALTGPNWSGTLPSEVTQVSVPLDVTQWIIRADKYSSTGEDQIAEAVQFRSSLRLGTLSEYLTDPSVTVPVIAPVELASIPFKGLADHLCDVRPINFSSNSR